MSLACNSYKHDSDYTIYLDVVLDDLSRISHTYNYYYNHDGELVMHGESLTFDYETQEILHAYYKNGELISRHHCITQKLDESSILLMDNITEINTQLQDTLTQEKLLPIIYNTIDCIDNRDIPLKINVQYNTKANNVEVYNCYTDSLKHAVKHGESIIVSMGSIHPQIEYAYYIDGKYINGIVILNCEYFPDDESRQLLPDHSTRLIYRQTRQQPKQTITTYDTIYTSEKHEIHTNVQYDYMDRVTMIYNYYVNLYDTKVLHGELFILDYDCNIFTYNCYYEGVRIDGYVNKLHPDESGDIHFKYSIPNIEKRTYYYTNRQYVVDPVEISYANIYHTPEVYIGVRFNTSGLVSAIYNYRLGDNGEQIICGEYIEIYYDKVDGPKLPPWRR